MTDENQTFEARLLTPNDYKGFATVYNDFVNRAVTEYNFELEPLDYDGFIDAVEKKLIECVVLFESSIPVDAELYVSMLQYTTAISEAVELNIIHSLKMENMVERAMYLIKKFLELTKAERLDKIVCYPMLGAQKDLIGDIARYGFKFVGIAVLRFMMSGTNSRDILKITQLTPLDSEYKLVDWQDKYFEDAVEVVQEGFENSADALFDPRFKTIDGTRDIITKIVKNIYAEFLPEATTILLCNNIPVGFCFMNLTGGRIAIFQLLR